jgi:hypothetical protein
MGKHNLSSDRARYRSFLQQMKSVTPCMDCGIQYPHYIMEFDHLEGGNRNNSVMRLASTRSWAKIGRELDKCEVVCANCHKVRTWRRHNVQACSG